MSASLFMKVPLIWMILLKLDVKTHYVFRPINVHKFHLIYVHDVLIQGSVMEAWWMVTRTIWN